MHAVLECRWCTSHIPYTMYPITSHCAPSCNACSPGVQVVYFTDALDEYLMANMPEYDDIKFQDVTKDDLKIGKDKAQKKREKKVKVRALVKLVYGSYL